MPDTGFRAESQGAALLSREMRGERQRYIPVIGFVIKIDRNVPFAVQFQCRRER
jgi:hypothetical protein